MGATWGQIAGGGPRDKRSRNDYYPTPAPVTRELLKREKFPGPILEPCAGQGHMVRELERHGLDVRSNEPHGSGQFLPTWGFDFLQTDVRLGGCRSIVANPPYRFAEKFIRKAIDLGFDKHAWLLRMQFMESKERFALFRDDPPARIWVFSKRVQITERGLKRPIGGMIVYAWWVWDGLDVGKHPELRWIEPDAIGRDEVTP